MKKELIDELRGLVVEKLKTLEDGEHVKLELSPQLLDVIFFKEMNKGSKFYHKEFYDEFREHLGKIDFTGISFDNIKVSFLDFTGSIGIDIDPQKVYMQDLEYDIFKDVNFVGKSFDEVDIRGTDFTGSVGAEVNIENTFYDSTTVFNDAFLISHEYLKGEIEKSFKKVKRKNNI